MIRGNQVFKNRLKCEDKKLRKLVIKKIYTTTSIHFINPLKITLFTSFNPTLCKKVCIKSNIFFAKNNSFIHMADSSTLKNKRYLRYNDLGENSRKQRKIEEDFSYLNNLPTELIWNILKFCDYQTLINLSEVNQRIREIVFSEFSKRKFKLVVVDELHEHLWKDEDKKLYKHFHKKPRYWRWSTFLKKSFLFESVQIKSFIPSTVHSTLNFLKGNKIKHLSFESTSGFTSWPFSTSLVNCAQYLKKLELFNICQTIDLVDKCQLTFLTEVITDSYSIHSLFVSSILKVSPQLNSLKIVSDEHPKRRFSYCSYFEAKFFLHLIQHTNLKVLDCDI
jgi:hypothetical protein